MSSCSSEAFATLDELRAHWPAISDALLLEAEQKLIEASLEIRGLYPDISERIAQGSLDKKVVALVVTRMVKRAMEQPSEQIPAGLTQFQTTVGPFAQSMSFTGRDGTLYLTAADRRLLAPKKLERKAWTIEVS